MRRLLSSMHVELPASPQRPRPVADRGGEDRGAGPARDARPRAPRRPPRLPPLLGRRAPGLPYAFADFINPRGTEIAQLYKERFEPSDTLPTSRQMVAVWALAADTDEEAERLASSSQMAMRMLRQGRLIPVPPVETALRFL